MILQKLNLRFGTLLVLINLMVLSNSIVKANGFVPTGGEIVVAPSTSNVNEISLCPNSSVSIVNKTDGDPNALVAYSYSWEISENSGANWVALSNINDGDYSYPYELLRPLRENISINNIKKSFWIRRKITNAAVGSPFAYSNIVKINIQQNTLNFPNGIKSYTTILGTTFNLPTITASVPGSIITIYNPNGTVVAGNTITLNQKGTFYYSVKAVSPLGCETLDTFQIIVYDNNDCSTKIVRTYAKKALPWTSGLSSTFFADDAVDNNNAGYATLSGGVVLLGIGTVGIDLYFEKSPGVLYTPSELNGKKITIKLGEQYSGLKLAGGISVIARSYTSTDINNAGTTIGVKGGVLDLLKGDNVFTYSFVPKNTSGANVGFNGVRIQLGSLIGVADLASVFYAYIEDEIQTLPGTCTQETKTVTPWLYNIDNTTKSLLYPTSQTDIEGNVSTVVNVNFPLNKFVEDITWGNRSEVLNVASALSSVVNPYFAVDTDYNSYALFNATAGVLNQQFLQVHLQQRAQPGDQIRLVLSYPNMNVLNLRLLQLGNFKLVYYLGDTKVGEDPMEQFRILDIGLLNMGNNKKVILAKPITIPFDRIEIQQFQTINVNIGDGLRIHDIRIQPQILFEGQLDPKQVTKICAAEMLGIQKPSPCTSYELSLAKVTSWGSQLTNEDGNLLYETDGITPIYSILAVEDIAGSSFGASIFTGNNSNGTFTDYYNIPRMFTSDENNGILLLKVQAKRAGCNYSDPEYLKIRLLNCNDAMVNPVLRVMSSTIK